MREKKVKSFLYSFIIFLNLLFLISCQSGTKKDSLNSKSGEVIRINRYEKVLFSINPDSLKWKLTSLQKEYRFFIGENINDEFNIKQLHDYLADPVVKELYAECLRIYPNLNDVEKDLSDALLNYKKIFTGVKLPRVYTYVSGISSNTNVNYLDTVLVIPLDMYLGSNYTIYSKIGIPQFIRMRLTKDYIVRDCMIQIAMSKLPEMKDKTLLDVMIEKGKILYFTQKLSVKITDEINIAYTKEQTEWNRTNEANLWSFLIGNKLLFSKDQNTINKFTGEAPFTSVISQQAPGRIGEWLGWQIVKSYMEKNKNVSLPALMNDTDCQQILNNSGYKPQK